MQSANFCKTFVGYEGFASLIDMVNQFKLELEQLCIDIQALNNHKIDPLKNSCNLLLDSKIFYMNSEGILFSESDSAKGIEKLRSYLLSNEFIDILSPALKYYSGDLVIDSCLLPSEYATYPQVAFAVGILDMPFLTRYWPIQNDSVQRLHKVAEAVNRAELSKENFSILDLKNKLNKQSELGLEAEEWFLNWEKNRLAGHVFSNLISRVSDYNVAAGYDLISFKSLDSLTFNRYIEVKSYSEIPRIFISANELEVARKYQDEYVLVILDRSKFTDKNYVPIEFVNPYALLMSSEKPEWVSVSPESFRVDFTF
jgi:hypothetical protein